jgi:hypothetical protein
MPGISYGYGHSSLGGFLTALDDKGVCAILLGDDRAQLASRPAGRISGPEAGG